MAERSTQTVTVTPEQFRREWERQAALKDPFGGTRGIKRMARVMSAARKKANK